ncbi:MULTISPECIES: RNA methyltransferase [unclassified Lentimicrobium]|uniref:RNA methyltransferase n=1 Tax=unclassified Lentimicrobium TaxID=2677434 RepID=UPI0015547169|nr:MULTISPECIES: RNA methyltransferase [unclassified Lentimicrobium]NPD47240.1 RNA methyltransferase [Lentimicrobium sp. S6]NPD83757.1 RNA methyltransferase [Lentimicrobium sp. L6]
MSPKYKKLSLKELNRLDLDQYHEKKKIPMVIVLDNIRSMSNIGSVFRTSDAFLVEEIHLCGITSCPPNKEIHKTALGATESVKWKYFKDTLESIQSLKEESYQIISVEQAKNSTKLDHYSAHKNQKIAFVFGNEVKGVAQEVIDKSDFCLEIPQYGTKHSLNISISAGIVIWHAFNSMNT